MGLGGADLVLDAPTCHRARASAIADPKIVISIIACGGGMFPDLHICLIVRRFFFLSPYLQYAMHMLFPNDTTAYVVTSS